MRRSLIIFALIVFSGSSLADIAVNLKNLNGWVSTAGSGRTTGLQNVLIQLIWSDTDPATHHALEGGAVDSGEYLLATKSDWDYGYHISESILYTFDDSFVGGAVDEDDVIRGGYFFVRMFDANALDNGDYYLQQYVQTPTLSRYDSLTPSTIYDTNTSIGGLDIDAQGNQVIPEPAVASLIVIFGGGLLIGKRLFSKS